MSAKEAENNDKVKIEGELRDSLKNITREKEEII